MRQRMVVTDLTRMQGARICVGGYLEDGTPIRPVCGQSGPTEAWLQPTPDERVVPFSLVELDVGAPVQIVPPHTEDRLVPTTGHRVIQTMPDQGRLSWLGWSESPSVREIFGAEVQSAPGPEQPWGRYIRSGEGIRSLGTIRVDRVQAVRYHRYPDRGQWDYRLRFRDGSQEEFQLAVVDLEFRSRLDALRDSGLSADRAATEILTALQRQTVYMRIGLARGWDRHPDRCYLQITGVYGFSL
jgi:hypothetical protein